jgi:1,4-alpha-glucan branching enzyme
VTVQVGSCAIVLHTHLPWLAHHGSWPVGEEWLYQAWSGAYLPVAGVLERLAAEGRTGLLTLGVTPVLAAMLDDPYCLGEFHTWLATWQLRAEGAAVRGVPTAGYEGRLAARALTTFERRWRHGASPVLRDLADAGAVQLLGGPATHTFTPFLPGRLARFALLTGLDDASLRVGRRPRGIWAPECAYAPGLEQLYADAGVEHFVVDGPLARGHTCAPVDVAGSGVIAFARDLDVTYRVWSPKAGYPGGPAYRDFHTFDHASGLRASRVTSARTRPGDKRPYDPRLARAAVARDASDFVDRVVARLRSLPGDDPLVVVAYDTELYGHWWHEGPQFLEAVLRALPEAGVRLRTLANAAEQLPATRRALPAGSWGTGKDFGVWEVPDMRRDQERVAERLLAVVDKADPCAGRSASLDQLAREALLALASDWPFSVTKDSATEYARDRFAGHRSAFHRLADTIEAADPGRTATIVAATRARDYPFGHLDAVGLRANTPRWKDGHA